MVDNISCLGAINALKCNRASDVIAILRKTASFAPFRKLAHATEVRCYIFKQHSIAVPLFVIADQS